MADMGMLIHGNNKYIQEVRLNFSGTTFLGFEPVLPAPRSFSLSVPKDMASNPLAWFYRATNFLGLVQIPPDAHH